jgi:cytochrome c oxidase subunit 3
MANPKISGQPHVASQFEDAEQQHEVATLGMWTFIATEILFFGGLFLAYLVYRQAYPHDFAIASRHTNLFFGMLNSIILITSSFTMALAVRAAFEQRLKFILRSLAATIILGAGFLAVKGLEYREDIAERLVPGPNFDASLPQHAQLFFYLYWVMTGLHLVHIVIGLGILLAMLTLAKQGKFSEVATCNSLEVAGLYWHFVDVVWIFLFPLLYLLNRHA